MSKARKTIEVEKLRDWANHFLKNSPDDKVQGREEICAFIETVLHTSNRYFGFKYLQWPVELDSETFDETRRHYH